MKLALVLLLLLVSISYAQGKRDLDLQFFSCSHDYGTAIIKGKVKNTSSRDIRFLQVAGEFYDKNKNVIATDTTFIETYRNFPSGHSSGFEIRVSSSGFSYCRITSFFTTDGELSFTYKGK